MPSTENVARFLAAADSLGLPRFNMVDLEKVLLYINFMQTELCALCVCNPAFRSMRFNNSDILNFR